MAIWTNKCYCCTEKYNSLSATLDHHWGQHPTHTFSALNPADPGFEVRGSTFLGIRIAPPLRGFPEATIKVYT